MSALRREAALFLLLCLLLPLCLTGCGEVTAGASGLETPQGMQDATRVGQDFAFFIPSGWAVDHSTGISIATPSTFSTVNVTAASFASSLSAEEYFKQSEDEIAAKFTDFAMVDEQPVTLIMDEAAAVCYTYTGKYYTGTEMQQSLYITRKDGRLYVLTYTASVEEADSYRNQVKAIVDCFRFLTPTDSETPTPSPVEGDAPDGMRDIANSAINAYRFFIPEEWVTDMQTGITSAYVSESDRSSVSLTCTYPQNSAIRSIKDYWDALQTSYKNLYTDYRIISEQKESDAPTEIGGYDGAKYVFAGESGGVSYRVMQIFFVRGSYIYTFTYTATEENYETHLPTVEKIVSEIRFN